jgi:hypothetical protein
MNEPTTTHARHWAVVRVLLGTVQVMAATVGVMVLLPSGANVLWVGAASIAIALISTSLVLFRESRQ